MARRYKDAPSIMQDEKVCFLFVVEQQQLLVFGGMAHGDVAGNVVRIVSVAGLTGCQHDIVGNVHQCIDGTHAYAPDTALHLEGRGLDAQTIDLGADEAGTGLGVVNRHLDMLGEGCIGDKGSELLQGQIVECGDLACDTVVTPQIGAVGHGLVVDFQNNVVQIQRLGKRCTGRYIEVTQIEDSSLVLKGKQIKQADFRGSADHAVAFHTAQLALLDLHRLAFAVPAAERAGQGHRHTLSLTQIGAAADDVADVAADVGLADTQLVGIGVLLNGPDDTHHHVVKLLGKVRGVFHFHSGHGQIVSQLLQVHIRRHINIIFYPRK